MGQRREEIVCRHSEEYPGITLFRCFYCKLDVLSGRLGVKYGLRGERAGSNSIDECAEILAIFPVCGKVCDVSSRKGGVEPLKEALLPHRVWATKVGHIYHDREFIRLLDCKILGMHHLRNAEILFSEVHSICDILETVVWVERGVVWNQTGLAVVDEGREIDTVVPIR